MKELDIEKEMEIIRELEQIVEGLLEGEEKSKAELVEHSIRTKFRKKSGLNL